LVQAPDRNGLVAILEYIYRPTSLTDNLRRKADTGAGKEFTATLAGGIPFGMAGAYNFLA
jgi:hypothetical protein